MIRDLVKYLLDEAKPRFWQLVGTDCIISLLVGISCGLWGERVLPISSVKGTDVATALLTYAALALGFSLAGLTLVLTIPSKELVQAMLSSKPPKTRADAYSDLIFIFSWTALSHWVIVSASVCLLVFAGNQQVWVQFPSNKYRAIAGLITGISTYGLLQFLIILITLYQLAKVNMAFQRPKPAETTTHNTTHS